MDKQPLVTITAKDCRFDYYKAPGKGGQKKNKTESAVRCTHIASGAVGNCSETRSQHKNKSIAFRRMSETKTFGDWLKIENAKAMGMLKDIDEKVEKEMKNVLIEVREDDKWISELSVKGDHQN